MSNIDTLIDQVLTMANSAPPPATSAEIDRVRADVAGYDRVPAGTSLPDDYLALMRKSNGPDIDGGDNDIRFLSLSEEGWTTFDAYNGDDSPFMDDDIDTYAPFKPLLMFAANVGSDFWAFGRAGSVVFCDHETGDVWPQASSFAEFLQQVVDGTATDRDRLEAVQAVELATSGSMRRFPDVVSQVREMSSADVPRLYVIEPDSPGHFGRRTVALPPKDDYSQPTMVTVECELERWPVDAIMDVGFEVLVTDGLAADLVDAGLTGFEVQPALVSVNARFRQREQARANEPLPNLCRLVLTATAEYDRLRQIVSYDGEDLVRGINIEPVNFTPSQIMAGDYGEIVPHNMLIVSERFLHLLDAHGAASCSRTPLAWAGL